MLDLFAARPDMVLILRPHPILFKHLASQGLMSVEEIDLFQRRFVGSPNMIMDERADFTHAFAVSDALISDASSFLTLYGAIGKPIQYLPNPTGPGLNEEGEIVDAYYKGDSAEAIGRFVEMIGDGEDPLRERRQAVFDQFVYRPQEGAGVFIKKYIINAVRRGI
jgi:CDP-glycerol glycerophosphotransferase (TagB/SpsB family)